MFQRTTHLQVEGVISKISHDENLSYKIPLVQDYKESLQDDASSCQMLQNVHWKLTLVVINL